jgi:hypothetical protein
MQSSPSEQKGSKVLAKAGQIIPNCPGARLHPSPAPEARKSFYTPRPKSQLDKAGEKGRFAAKAPAGGGESRRRFFSIWGGFGGIPAPKTQKRVFAAPAFFHAPSKSSLKMSLKTFAFNDGN